MAPEVIEKTPYGKAADLWSLGAVIYDMLVGSPPFHVSAKEKREKQRACNRSNTNRSATKYNILHCNYKIPDHLGQDSRSLINQLLQLDVETRLGGYEADLEHIKDHDFFEGINWLHVSDGSLDPPFVPRLEGNAHHAEGLVNPKVRALKKGY
jgi:serine/threonine protein kinase